MADVTVVVPAYEEADRIDGVVRELLADRESMGGERPSDAFEILVVDDGSTDRTAAVARDAGATVLELAENRGYAPALSAGFREASGDVVVTIDGDGEHRPADVERLVRPVAADRLDLVLGARSTIPRRSEKLLNALVRWKAGISDAYTGFRAMRRSLATGLELDASTTCATLVLDAAAAGARLGEVEIETRTVEKPRGVAREHGRHLLGIARRLATA